MKISIEGRTTEGLVAEFDLYVHDAAGNEIARSTRLGDDELVLEQPASGDYRVYVQSALSIDTAK